MRVISNVAPALRGLTEQGAAAFLGSCPCIYLSHQASSHLQLAPAHTYDSETLEQHPGPWGQQPACSAAASGSMPVWVQVKWGFAAPIVASDVALAVNAQLAATSRTGSTLAQEALSTFWCCGYILRCDACYCQGCNSSSWGLLEHASVRVSSSSSSSPASQSLVPQQAPSCCTAFDLRHIRLCLGQRAARWCRHAWKCLDPLGHGSLEQGLTMAKQLQRTILTVGGLLLARKAVKDNPAFYVINLLLEEFHNKASCCASEPQKCSCPSWCSGALCMVRALGAGSTAGAILLTAACADRTGAGMSICRPHYPQQSFPVLRCAVATQPWLIWRLGSACLCKAELSTCSQHCQC